jgi:methylated-DNA-[protein]-cysteine S-methyltransferase
MQAQGYALFDTAVGRCGVAWSERGIVGVQLPERYDAGTAMRLLRRHPNTPEAAPPDVIQRAIDAMVALLRGERRDLSDIALDLEDVPPFQQQVYAVARSIPAGATMSYGEIAARVGDSRAARDVGEAMGRNPCPIVVPCHRVLAANGKLGGFSAAGGLNTKLRMLDIERAQISEAPTLFDSLPLAVKPRRG